MAYNNKNYLEKIKQAVEVTKAHYEPGRQDRNHRWVWNNYIYDMFHVGYICPGCAGTLIIALISSG